MEKMKVIKNKLWLLALMGIIIASMNNCANPNTEELNGGTLLHLAILSFKKDGRYIVCELDESKTMEKNAVLIAKIKALNEGDDLDNIDDVSFYMINSIEQFDSMYEEGTKTYFVEVKRFVEKKKRYKYIFSSFFDETNFGVK